eukprot:2717927-Pleurochrysis_carterae.AAC.2
MQENKGKRDILPLGSTATKSELTMQTCLTNGRTPPQHPTGWKNPNETIISLRILHGNTTNFDDFLITKYTQAKAKLASAKSIHQLTINGRNKMLNSNYYVNQSLAKIPQPPIYRSPEEEQDALIGKHILEPFNHIGQYHYFTHEKHRGRKYSLAGLIQYPRNI